MKKSITFLLFFIVFSFSEIKAQRTDTTARLPLMKSKSQIFIAEVKTDEGVRKGILYDADERKVVILDSVYQKVIIQVASIKSIVLRRSNNLWYGFRTGFLVSEIPVVILSFALLVSDVPGWGLVAFVYGTPYALFVGGVFLLLSAIPSISFHVDTPQDYIDKLNPLHRHSQVYLLKKYAPKLRMRR